MTYVLLIDRQAFHRDNEAADPQSLLSWRRILPELIPWRSKR
jgi:hypothetical protein